MNAIEMADNYKSKLEKNKRNYIANIVSNDRRSLNDIVDSYITNFNGNRTSSDYKQEYKNQLSKRNDIQKDIQKSTYEKGVQTTVTPFSTQRNTLPTQEQTEVTKNKKFEITAGQDKLGQNKDIENKYQEIKKSNEYKNQMKKLEEQSNEVGYAKYNYDKQRIAEDDIGWYDKSIGRLTGGIGNLFDYNGGLIKNENGDLKYLPTFNQMKHQKVKENYKTGIGRFAGDVLYESGKIIGSTAINQVLPGVGSTMYFGKMFVDSTNQAVSDGYDTSSATMYGLVNVGLEYGVGKMLGSATKGLTGGKTGDYEELLKKTFTNITKKPKIANVLANAGSEATEEFVQEYLDNISKLLILDKNTNIKDYASVFLDGDVLSDALYSAAIGGVTGGIIGTATGKDSNVENKDVNLYKTFKEELEETRKNTTNKETINKIDTIISNIDSTINNNSNVNTNVDTITSQINEYETLKEQNRLTNEQEIELNELKNQLSAIQNQNTGTSTSIKEEVNLPTVQDIVNQEKSSQSGINLPVYNQQSSINNSDKAILPTVNDFNSSNINMLTSDIKVDMAKINPEILNDIKGFKLGEPSIESYKGSYIKTMLNEVGIKVPTAMNYVSEVRPDMSFTTTKDLTRQQYASIGNALQKLRSVDVTSVNNANYSIPIGNYQYVKSSNANINELRRTASMYLNNTARSNNTIRLLENIIKDRNYIIRFNPNITNEQGVPVNGLITKENGKTIIELNPNADNYVEFLVVHEITHDIATKEMKELILDYAKQDPEFEKSLESLKERYKTNDVSDEVVADVCGELFGNREFIQSVVEKKPNIFKKILNNIRRLAEKIKGTGANEYVSFVEKLKIMWEDAYYSNRSNLKDKMFSIQQDSNGNKYVEVDTDQDIFEGVDEKDYNKIAKMYITDYLMGNTALATDSNAIIDSRSARKYTNPGDRQRYFTEKMKLSPELKNVLAISEKISESLPTKESTKYSKWEYYKINFKINDQIFTGKVNIGIDTGGKKHFYEVNNIKKASGISGISPNYPTGFSANNISQSNNNVNSDTSSTTKYSIPINKNNTQELDNSSFSNDLNKYIFDNDFYVQFKYEDKTKITKTISELKSEKEKLDPDNNEDDWVKNYHLNTKIKALENGYNSEYDYLVGREKERLTKDYEFGKLTKQIEEKKRLEAKKNQLQQDIKESTPFKNAQYKIIQETNPMFDEEHVGIRSPKDIKTFEEVINDEDSFTWGDYSKEDAIRDLKKGTVTIYSSYPIKNGTFVSTSYQQALDYAGGDPTQVHSRKASLNSIAWINGDEGQYAKVYSILPTKYSMSISETNIQKQNDNFFLDEKTKQQLRELDLELKKVKEQYNRMYYNDKKTRDAKIKGNAMRIAAEKRNVIQGDWLISVPGGLTQIELDNKIKKLKSNYIGKKVIVNDNKGKIIGVSFGRIGVKFENGETSYVNPNDIISVDNIDDIIKEQTNKYNKLISKNKNVKEWNEYLKDNFPSAGTKTKMSDIKLPIREDIKNDSKKSSILNPNEISKLTKEDANTTPILPKRRSINKVNDGNSHFAKNIKDKVNMLNAEQKAEILSKEDIRYYDKENTNKILNSNENISKNFELNYTPQDPTKESTYDEPEKLAEILKEKPNTIEEKDNWLKKLATIKFIDKGYYVDKLARKVKNKELSSKYDYSLLSNGIANQIIGNGRVDEKGNKVGKGLYEIFEPIENSGLLDDFSRYIYHKHNIDRMSLQNRFNEANKAVFGDAMTSDMSEKIVNEYETKYPEFESWADDIYEYNKANLEMLVKYGVLSKDSMEYYNKKYPHYVPTIREQTKTKTQMDFLLGKKASVNNPIKKAKGGNGNIIPLKDAMALRTMQTVNSALRNNFGLELLNSIETEQIRNQENIDNIVEEINSDELLAKSSETSPATLTVFDKGEKVTFDISDEIYEALKPSNIKTFKFLNKLNNIRRGLLTEYNPTFMITNPLKDIQDGSINSKHPKLFIKNLPEAIKQIKNNGQYKQLYIANGGSYETYFNYNTGTNIAPSKLDKIAPLKKISEINELIEMAPRLAEFISSIEAGDSIETAMYNASEITTNFKRGGDITKTLDRNGVTFLNAGVQGTTKQVRNVQEARVEGIKGITRLAVRWTITGLVPTLLMNMIWGDDDDYEELSDYVKNNYYIIGKYDNGEFIRIPKGRVISVLQSFFQNALNGVEGKKMDLKGFADLIENNLLPSDPNESSLIAPIKQAINNETWYGGDLVPTRLQNLPNAEQYDETTDSISIWLGKMLNISPYKINYVLDQYAGAIGDYTLPYLTQAAESGSDSFTGKLLAPIKDKFTVDSSLKNQNISDFYSLSEELTKKSNSSSATDEDILKNKYINSVKSEISKLYAKKREIQSSSLKDSEKYNKSKKIQKEINELSKSAIYDYKNVVSYENYGKISDQEYYLNGKSEWIKVKDAEKEEINKLNMSDADKNKYFKTKVKIGVIRGNEEKESNIKHKEIADLVIDSGLNDNFKGYLYGKYYSSEKIIETVLNAKININEYIKFDSETFESDYYTNGKTVPNSRKNKVIKYINSLNLSIPQKAMLIKMEYSSFKQYDNQIVKYVNNIDCSSYDKKVILKTIGFTSYDKDIINTINSKNISVEEKTKELEELGFKVRNGRVYTK